MIDELREKCAEEGFDLCDPIHTRWYNDLIVGEGHVAKGTLKQIPEPPTIFELKESCDSSSSGYNAVLIGNSKSMWPKFIAWLSVHYKRELEKKKNCQCSLSNEEILSQILNNNPLDEFVTSTLSKVFQSCCSVESGDKIATQLDSYEFFWSNGEHYKVDLLNHQSGDKERLTPKSNKDRGDYHCDVSNEDKSSSSFLVSMQRVATLTGKYWHDEEGTKLCVHPKFGTWKAFRLVVVFHNSPNVATDPTTSIPDRPPMCPCPVSTEEIQRAREVMKYALEVSGRDNNDTSSYGSGGGKIDLCKYLHNSVSCGSDWSTISPKMRPWIQLRDCITVGRDKYKYSDNQLLYHYTKDTEILKRELAHVLKAK